jgi:hypothetical protein
VTGLKGSKELGGLGLKMSERSLLISKTWTRREFDLEGKIRSFTNFFRFSLNGTF